MTQNINNEGGVHSQLNVNNFTGNVYLAKKTRFARRFEKLNQEVKNDERYEGTMESLKFYLTKLDGISAETKLYDGGFNENEVISAIRRKERYAKRLQLNRFFESAQWIDSQLFAKIKMDFEAFILPLIDSGYSKSEILREVVINVVQPVLDLINIEGEDDEVLNYNADDIFGMVYYLTGQCHINWKNYDSI
ncbi:ABC-three component system protein [Tenacibaculum amylolyticum]|uniref:ABC-three component system protein n=1 Tax=Tenacibaculum amylolyticum TaxID=104269 RepID=UPI003894618E